MLSIVIVNWNTRDLLQACLTSLRKHAHDCQVIVVDNDSHDGSATMVRLDFPEVILVESGGNLGYATGNNIGFARATGDLILTLNPDTEVYEDTIGNALAFMATHPTVGALGAKQIFTDGSVQRSVRGFPSIIGMFGMWSKLDRLWPSSRLGSYRLPHFDYEQEQPAPQPMGTFNLFRRSALENPERPFDEQFPIFFNEVDLLYRLLKRGWPAWYSPSVRILHHGGESTKQAKKSMVWESHRSLIRYLRKHQPSSLLPVWAIIVYTLAFLRARGYHEGFRP